jgi:hypothetical protein
MPEEMVDDAVVKAIRIVDERLAILDAWEKERARQHATRRVDELETAKAAASEEGFELWERLTNTPAKSLADVAVKLAAVLFVDSSLHQFWTGASSGEMGERMVLAARADALRLAGMPHTFGTDKPPGIYIEPQASQAEV